MKRLLSIALALVLALALVPCAFAEDGYPMDGDYTLTVWCPLSDLVSPYFTNFGDTPASKDIERLTGVTLKYIHPSKGSEKENFNLLVAGGDIPDIMFTPSYAGGEVAGLEDGVYADLTPYIEECMPNYNKLLTEDKIFKKLASLDDGRVIAVYNYKTVLEPYWWRPQFRADLLEEFGMDEPFTIEQYEAFFEKVKETHPELTPYTLQNDGMNGAVMSAWNVGIISSTSYNWEVVDGKVSHTWADPGYYDYLKTMHEWYEKGYISKDFMSEDPTTMFQTGKVAAITGNGYEMFPTCTQLGVPITSGKYVRLNDGDKIHTLYHYWPLNGGQTFVSGKVDETRLKAILKFLDYGYSEEGIVTYNFGAKGSTWDELGEDGFPIYNDNMLNNDKYPVANAESILKAHAIALPRWRYGDGVCMATNQKNPDNWAYRARWGDDPDVDDTNGVPPLTISIEDNERRAEIMNNVTTHAKEMTLKYITGAADLANYDKEFTQVLKSFGFDEAIEITQRAYDAFMAD